MFLFSGAKIRCFLLPRSGFPLKGWGKIPTSLFCACAVLYIIRCRSFANFAPHALKGQKLLAQGNALGNYGRKPVAL